MKKKVVIIGAGVAGLVAALELEKRGYSPVVVEADGQPGGRVQTTKQDGITLDHGFQVLLTAYPEARQYLDYGQLNLKYFDRGAVIYDENNPYVLSDPRSNWSEAIPMLFSKVGSFKDKIQILSLARELSGTTVEEIFERESRSTLEELQKRGFSEKVIRNFFRPFFSGIFLEKELETSSRMFLFTLKMFAEGKAAIPAEGIQAIPMQLASRLKNTQITYNTEVHAVEPNRLRTSSGELDFDQLILSTHPGGMLPGFEHEKKRFREVFNMYFKTSRSINRPMIGLVPGNSLVNNFHFPTDLNPQWFSGGHLLSVSVIGPQDASVEELQKQVVIEMEDILKEKPEHIHSFYIRNALPVIDDLQYSIQPKSTKIQDNIFLAGDYLLNPSLNAAMLSGRLAAMAVAGT